MFIILRSSHIGEQRTTKERNARKVTFALNSVPGGTAQRRFYFATDIKYKQGVEK